MVFSRTETTTSRKRNLVPEGTLKRKGMWRPGCLGFVAGESTAGRSDESPMRAICSPQSCCAAVLLC